MKKLFIVFMIMLSFTLLLSSCGASKKTGCPGTEGIIK